MKILAWFSCLSACFKKNFEQPGIWLFMLSKKAAWEWSRDRSRDRIVFAAVKELRSTCNRKINGKSWFQSQFSCLKNKLLFPYHGFVRIHGGILQIDLFVDGGHIVVGQFVRDQRLNVQRIVRRLIPVPRRNGSDAFSMRERTCSRHQSARKKYEFPTGIHGYFQKINPIRHWFREGFLDWTSLRTRQSTTRPSLFSLHFFRLLDNGERAGFWGQRTWNLREMEGDSEVSGKGPFCGGGEGAGAKLLGPLVFQLRPSPAPFSVFSSNFQKPKAPWPLGPLAPWPHPSIRSWYFQLSQRSCPTFFALQCDVRSATMVLFVRLLEFGIVTFSFFIQLNIKIVTNFFGKTRISFSSHRLSVELLIFISFYRIVELWMISSPGWSGQFVASTTFFRTIAYDRGQFLARIWQFLARIWQFLARIWRYAAIDCLIGLCHTGTATFLPSSGSYTASSCPFFIHHLFCRCFVTKLLNGFLLRLFSS